MPDLHPDLSDLAGLLGTWTGRGRGDYPAIEPFTYDETIVFGHAGKPFLAYSQRTSHPATGAPMHVETGYWRRPGGGDLEVVIVQPTGVMEMHAGRLLGDGRRIELATTTVVCTPSAKPVTAVERVFELDGDVLRYELRMAAVGVTMTHHLAAELRRA